MTRYTYKNYWRKPVKILLIVDCYNKAAADIVFKTKTGIPIDATYVWVEIAELPKNNIGKRIEKRLTSAENRCSM